MNHPKKRGVFLFSKSILEVLPKLQFWKHLISVPNLYHFGYEKALSAQTVVPTLREFAEDFFDYESSGWIKRHIARGYEVTRPMADRPVRALGK